MSDANSPTNNVAGIADSKDIFISFSAQNYYGNLGLTNLYLSSIYPLKKAGISINLMRHGNEYLNQQKFGFGIAHKVGFVKMGLQVDYLQYQAEGFGSNGTIAFEFGGIAELTDKIIFGAHIFNFTQSSLKDEDPEQLPIIMKAGINYIPIPAFRTSIEIEKKILEEPLFKIGLEYEVISKLFCRTGITLNPFKNSFGLGYHLNRISFDYGFSHHQILGMTHQATLEIKLEKDE